MAALIRRADEAMYLSKQNGRNRVSVLLAPAQRAAHPTA
jgi:PleD family two-component response regulator